jgi:hypothetical protein
MRDFYIGALRFFSWVHVIGFELLTQVLLEYVSDFFSFFCIFRHAPKWRFLAHSGVFMFPGIVGQVVRVPISDSWVSHIGHLPELSEPIVLCFLTYRTSVD